MRRSSRIAEKREKETAKEEVKEKEKEKEKIDTFNLQWTDVDDDFLVLDSDQLTPSSKIAAFDLDGTLITPKSGKAFPVDRYDWTWWDSSVPLLLVKLYEDGFKIVIFTNQAGLEKGKTKKGDITGKILDIIKKLKIPVQVFISGSEGLYYKPSTTMWDHMVADFNGNMKIDFKDSFFCGDAAGRAKNWKSGVKKDHSCSDRKFAANCGLTFYTPEEYFLEEKAAPFEWGSINPLTLCTNISPPKAKEYHTSDLEMVIMIGPPASGKSTFSEKYFVPHGYERVNRDTLGTAAKCLKVAKDTLDEGVSVIIDNTNPSVSGRSDYINLARAQNIPVRCFYFQTSYELAAHLNYVRVRESRGKVRRIPDVAYKMYKKNFEVPTTDEGFTEIIEIEFNPDFQGDEKLEKYFKHWT
jgi:bifunctional polynucleotide phosphatase/kinase